MEEERDGCKCEGEFEEAMFKIQMYTHDIIIVCVCGHNVT